MEAIRKFRRAIGPESETLILVGLGIAAFLALIFLIPNEGWPAVAVWLTGGAIPLIVMLLFLTPRMWPAWHKQPLDMSVRFLALGLMAAGMATSAWAEFADRADPPGALMLPAGLLFIALLDFVQRNRLS